MYISWGLGKTRSVSVAVCSECRRLQKFGLTTEAMVVQDAVGMAKLYFRPDNTGIKICGGGGGRLVVCFQKYFQSRSRNAC